MELKRRTPEAQKAWHEGRASALRTVAQWLKETRELLNRGQTLQAEARIRAYADVLPMELATTERILGMMDARELKQNVEVDRLRSERGEPEVEF